MTPEEYLSYWHAIPSPPSTTELEAKEVVGGSAVWIARDHSGRQHLLVRIPDGAAMHSAGTHGLGVSVNQLRIAGLADANYVDLICLEPAVAATFAAVASEVADATVVAEPADRARAITNVLSEWRWFWGVDPTRLSVTDAIGLFGELWFLLRWAGVTSASITAWNAYDRSRHDFQWPERSVEVKASSRAGAVVHTIQNLDQLAPAETGQLYLYSIHVSRDLLAANTLTSLVSAVVDQLCDKPVERSLLLKKLSERNYTPAAADKAQISYRVTEEALYIVTGAFPRLTRDSFAGGPPPGITNISYQIDMNSCLEWRVGTHPEVWPPTP